MQHQTLTTSPEPINRTKVVVVGADGFVGGLLSNAVGAGRIVYGSTGQNDVHISRAEELVQRSDVAINAAGFRVRPGCAYADYRRSHLGATAKLVQWLRKGSLLIHISSASILGRSRSGNLGTDTPPDPKAFPCPAYAVAKLETDEFVEQAAAKLGFKVIFLHPAVIYSENGAGMIETLMRLAQKGITLRLYPRATRHHLCYSRLLSEVTRRVINNADSLPHLSRFLVADPFTVTNQELECMIHRYIKKTTAVVPVPVPLVSALLRHSLHSSNAKRDLKTQGEIFGVLNLDSEYDASATFSTLDIDESQYAIEKTLEPLIREALQ